MKTNLSFFNLFFEICIHPNKTIKLILENEPGYFVWPMVLTLSFLDAFRSSDSFPGTKYLSIHLPHFLLFIFWWLFGILGFLFYSWFVLIIGKWFGGKGTYLEVKTACAWAYPPFFFGLFFDFSRKILGLKMDIHGEIDLKDYFTRLLHDWHHIFLAISLLFAIWGGVLTVINIAWAHKISIWKSVFFSSMFWVLGWFLLFIIAMFFIRQYQSPHLG